MYVCIQCTINTYYDYNQTFPMAGIMCTRRQRMEKI